MAILQSVLYRGAAPTSNTTLYTVPGDHYAILTNVVVANTTSSSIAATISLNGTEIISESPVPGNDALVFDIRQVVEAGQLIEGLAASSGLNFHISGVEIDV